MKSGISDKIKFTLILLFVYIVLFEFVLPVNKILPRPSLLLESFVQIWEDYNFIYHLSFSSLIIYSSMILVYLFVSLFRKTILKIFLNFSSGFDNLSIFKYFPAFFFAIIFAYWFPQSLLAEFVFVLLALTVYLLVVIRDSVTAINENQLLVAKSIGMPDDQVVKKVLWKNVQPIIFRKAGSIHYTIWILVLIYEFIGNHEGIGHVYNMSLNYNDFAGLFSIAVYVSLLVFIGAVLIKYAESKIIFWEK
ncbi:MAG: ABC transporter permease subunit [Melioribacteraceae bacterium]|nr:ABC transporter permease subunit [Melioribacteraceae bacterium]